jgi:hypothetical protein
MSQEREAPDAILELSNLAGTVSEIQDDPDNPDGNWLDASSNNSDTLCRVSFPTPAGNPKVGADLQEFRALVRKYGGTGTPTAYVSLYENGNLIRSGSPVNVTGPLVISFTWNANEISTADGSLVECRVYGTKVGGAPSVRATVEVGAIEWNCEWELAGITGTIAGSLAAPSGQLTGAVAILGGLQSSLSPLNSSETGAVEITGAAAALLAALAAAQAGEVKVSGFLAATLAAVMAALEGLITGAGAIEGTITAQVDPLTGESAGQVKIAGALATLLAALRAEAAGSVGLEGGVAGVLEPLTATGTGIVRITGAAAVILATLMAALAGKVKLEGSLATELAAVMAALEGLITEAGAIEGAITAQIASLMGESAGQVKIVGVLATLLTALRAEAAGDANIEGGVAGVLEPFTATGTGAVKIAALLMVLLEQLHGVLDGQVSLSGAIEADLPEILASLTQMLVESSFFIKKLVLKPGEQKTISLEVKDRGSRKDLSGATLFLGVKKQKLGNYIFSKADQEFDKSQAASGIVAVDLNAADTDQPEATYIGELRCAWDGPVIKKSEDFFIQIKRAVTA